MATKFINLNMIALKVGVPVEELMQKLGIDDSIANEREAIDLLKSQLDGETQGKFETFLWLAGHHVEEISL